MLSELAYTSALSRRAAFAFDAREGMIRRPNLSVRILHRVFGSRNKPQRPRACCDYCDKAEIRRRGTVGYVSRIMGP